MGPRPGPLKLLAAPEIRQVAEPDEQRLGISLNHPLGRMLALQAGSLKQSDHTPGPPDRNAKKLARPRCLSKSQEYIPAVVD